MSASQYKCHLLQLRLHILGNQANITSIGIMHGIFHGEQGGAWAWRIYGGSWRWPQYRWSNHKHAQTMAELSRACPSLVRIFQHGLCFGESNQRGHRIFATAAWGTLDTLGLRALMHKEITSISCVAAPCTPALWCGMAMNQASSQARCMAASPCDVSNSMHVVTWQRQSEVCIPRMRTFPRMLAAPWQC